MEDRIIMQKRIKSKVGLGEGGREEGRRGEGCAENGVPGEKPINPIHPEVQVTLKRTN